VQAHAGAAAVLFDEFDAGLFESPPQQPVGCS
jgi:hypothetical protein